MYNPKIRGKHNRKNKAKYSPKPEPQAAPPPELESNWDRYNEEPKESHVSSGSNFSVLATAPITHGSHFQFKSDKGSELETPEPIEAPNLFNLDLTLLDKSLSTIPFHVRSGIDVKEFAKNQNSLSDNVNDYLAYLSTYKKTDPDIVFGSEVEPSGDSVCNKTNVKNFEPHRDTVETSKSQPERAEGDLEQWLDDILDD